MPLKIVRDDITKLRVDAIVNPSNRNLVAMGGVDLEIRQKAGSQLDLACKSLAPCERGQIKVTEGFNLPCKYIFHTVGPVWQDGQHQEGEILGLCYRNALRKAQELNLESIGFPLIATGNNLFPKDLALSVATNEISNFILGHELTVYLVVFDKKAYQISTQRFKEVAAYIDDNYVSAHQARPEDARLEEARPDRRLRARELEAARQNRRPIGRSEPRDLGREEDFDEEDFDLEDIECVEDVCLAPKFNAPSPKSVELEDMLSQLDESFSDMLLRKIHERGMTAVQCYKKANIDKKLFSKIQSNRFYRPRKSTVLAFALALELPLDEISEMLQKAGFALSRSSKADIIVEYYVQKHNYNIFEINETLFAFDQQLIGS